ncbi:MULTISPECIES: DMP19 family protein [unclassified Myroides]|uniref:DMP19 family protein n=1 Tax=unclassified Myroides TaxID=2642485 RepID=UPI003D2F88E7
MREFPCILLSTDSIASATALAVVHSNISVINYLRHAEVGDDELHPDAFASYCVDYYYNTVKNEGLASFIHKTQWDLDVVEIIHAGLLAMEATEHLAYFEKQMRQMKLFSKIKLGKFLQQPLDKGQEIAKLLEDKNFPTEDLTKVNATWLKQHPDTQLVSIEEMQEIINDFLQVD